jgi:Skp family chaperone for outer membrane proteins
MTSLNDLASALTAVDAKLTEAQTNILAKLKELEDALKEVQLPADAEKALSDLQAEAQALDSIVTP